MTGFATTSYQRLFEVRLLHHYWLDDGINPFDALNTNVRAERLRTYDIRPVLRVVPTPSTRKQLEGLRCLFIATGLGFVIATPNGILLAADTSFSFTVSVIDGRCLDYTALTMRQQAIYEVSDPSDHSPNKVVYRYKENVPVLSNLSGITRNLGAGATLFLSRDYPAPSIGDTVEALVLSGDALLQLTSDNPSATTQQLSASVADLPVYVHQGDAPAIAPPAGVMGAPARGVQLTDDVPNDIFALITLTAVRSDDDAFSFIDGTGAPKSPTIVYEVRFKNRSTYWTYLDKRTGVIGATEPQPLPLTFFGNAGTRQKPSRGTVKADKSGARIMRLISEIYI